MSTQEKIKELEHEITALWRVVEDERIWHPSIIREIKRRSQNVHRVHGQAGLRKADEVFAALRRRG